jgi:hypothetical protein
MDYKEKYLKYKYKYLDLVSRSKINQKGGTDNYTTNYTLYRYCQGNPMFSNPCLEHFGVDLRSLVKMSGKDRSSQSDDIIATGRINDTVVAVKVITSLCQTNPELVFNANISPRMLNKIIAKRIQKDLLRFENELLICKQLTFTFLIPQLLQNITWFYYGGICGYSYDTTENPEIFGVPNEATTPVHNIPPNRSHCSNIEIPQGSHIFAQSSNSYINLFMSRYLERGTTAGDTTAFMVIEKCQGSIDYFLKQINNTIPLDNTVLNIIMSFILQILLTLNYINNYESINYFNHNDLHTGNVLYTPTNQTEIIYNINGTSIRINTFGYLAKIWDFGTSFMDPISVTIPKSGDNYNIDPQNNLQCVLDIPVFMDNINEKFIKLLNQEIISRLNEQDKEIFMKIKILTDYYIKFLDRTEKEQVSCGAINKELSNRIFTEPILRQVLDDFIV